MSFSGILSLISVAYYGTFVIAYMGQFTKLGVSVNSITPTYNNDSNNQLQCVWLCHLSHRCIAAQFRMQNDTCTLMESCTLEETADSYNVSTFLKVKPACDTNWTFYAGNCYLAVDSAVTWFEAVSACEAMGANLTSATSQAEYDIILSTRIDPDVPHWIGGRSVEDGSVFIWHWHYAEPWRFESWAPGEPNFNSSEKCLSVNQATMNKEERQNLWNDRTCGQLFYFICKKRLVT